MREIFASAGLEANRILRTRYGPIAMDRSISAWAGLHAALGEDADGILDLLAQLTAVRREAEKIFPAARAFVRPGFEDGGKAAKSKRRARD